MPNSKFTFDDLILITEHYMGQEQENTVVYVVKLRAYGKPYRVRADLDKALGRALHFAFHDRFEYQRDGKRMVYDQFADDGEHVGHDESVTTDEPDEPDKRQRLKELAEKVFPNAATGLDTILRSESARICHICGAVVTDKFKGAHMEWHKQNQY